MTTDRLGLVGAVPVGDRWRAQGYVNGTTRYLGTFDSEEEASAVFLHEKDKVEAIRHAEAEAEVERILASPTFVYEGGKGRGATLNGHRFKVLAPNGPHQSTCVPVLSDGTLGFDARRIVLNAYLKEEPKPVVAEIIVAAPKPKVADRVQEPDAGVKDEVLRFINRVPHQDTDWSLRFLIKHGRPGIQPVIDAVVGQGGVSEMVDFLRDATDVPESVLREAEKDTLGSLYMDDEARAAQRVMPRAFPEACSVNAGYDEFSPED